MHEPWASCRGKKGSMQGTLLLNIITRGSYDLTTIFLGRSTRKRETTESYLVV